MLLKPEPAVVLEGERNAQPAPSPADCVSLAFDQNENARKNRTEQSVPWILPLCEVPEMEQPGMV